MQLTIITTSSDQTEQLGERLATHLHGGECIELRSDIGGGKTTFVRGVVRALGSTEAVSSPSFTIAKHYQARQLRVYHYDFYRLAEPGLIAEELAEGLQDPEGITIIEWADAVEHVLPKERLQIEFRKSAGGNDERQIVLKGSPALLKALGAQQ